MRKVVMEFNVYRYEELNEDAKEVAKQWYLDGQEPDIFTILLEDELNLFFPNSDLKVGYSFNYNIGDGVNISGNISLKDVLFFAEKEKLDKETYKYAHDFFTEEELSLLTEWFEEMELVGLPEVSRGVHDPSCPIAIIYFLEDNKDFGKCVKPNLKFPIGLVKKFQRFFSDSLTTLTREFEKMGYEFFYEISDKDLKEICESNNYWFYESGKFYE